ncbi:MAG: hypothetical protein ACRDCW_08475 [Sarcina sp.]
MKAKKFLSLFLATITMFSVTLFNTNTSIANASTLENIAIEKGATDIYWEVDAILSKKFVSKQYLGTVNHTTTYILNGSISLPHGASLNGGITHSVSKNFKKYRYTTRYTIRYRKVTAMGNFLGYETVTSNCSHIVHEPI